MHDTSFQKIESFRDKYMATDSKLDILDICGLTKDASCKFIFSEKDWSFKEVGVHRTGVLKKEIKDESFDVVVIGQTLERVNYFWVLLSEIQRVVRPNGFLCAIVSSSGAFSAQGDFYRFHPEALISLAEVINFDVIGCDVDPMNIWRDATLIARKRDAS